MVYYLYLPNPGYAANAFIKVLFGQQESQVVHLDYAVPGVVVIDSFRSL